MVACLISFRPILRIILCSLGYNYRIKYMDAGCNYLLCFFKWHVTGLPILYGTGLCTCANRLRTRTYREQVARMVSGHRAPSWSLKAGMKSGYMYGSQNVRRYSSENPTLNDKGASSVLRVLKGCSTRDQPVYGSVRAVSFFAPAFPFPPAQSVLTSPAVAEDDAGQLFYHLVRYNASHLTSVFSQKYSACSVLPISSAKGYTSSRDEAMKAAKQLTR